MIKRFSILILVLISCSIHCLASAVSESNPLYGHTGYSCDVTGGVLTTFESYEVLFPIVMTSHGYTFGNGVFLGGGIAMEFRTQSDFNPNTLFCYADCKYSVLNKSDSPYIRGRLGMSYGNSSEYVGVCAMPECGFDFGKFSAGLAAIWDSQLKTDSGIRLQLGVSYRF